MSAAATAATAAAPPPAERTTAMVIATTAAQHQPSSYQAGLPAVAESRRREPPQYRGGFTTSICDLFRNPQDRSSCCAVVCCGIFLQERNQNAMDGTVPKCWSVRLVAVILICFVLVLIPPLGAVLLIAVLLWLIWGTSRRARMRQKIREMLVLPTDPTNTPNSAHYFCSTNRRAHRCISCIKVDTIYQDHPATGHELEELCSSPDYENDRQEDCCSCAWNCLATSCCGCCGCWFNFCGMCATAQEHRELRRLLPAERFEADYITFQPYYEYVPGLETLRKNETLRVWHHVKALSTLSSYLLRFLLVSVVILFILGALRIFNNFAAANVFIIVATLLQAFLVLYFVHWRKHRFDLSLDAVIKLFASGFVVSTAVALVIEKIVANIGALIFEAIYVFQYDYDNPTNEQSQPSHEELMYDIYHNHLPTLILSVIFESFVVASLVEETSKYFCWWMVEHPDYLPPSSFTISTTTTITDPSPSPVPSQTTTLDSSAIATATDQPSSSLSTTGPVVPRSIESRAAAITAGMVSTAAGFACCENMLYCLGAGSSYRSQLGVLIMRSLLPIHPIAAAMQSIGIVRREIEKDGCQLGLALLPAIFFHGLFDVFALMGSIEVYSTDPNSNSTNTTSTTNTTTNITTTYNTTTNSTTNDETQKSEEEDLLTGLFLLINYGIMIIGLICYFIAAYRQRKRLRALEEESTTGDCAVEASNVVATTLR